MSADSKVENARDIKSSRTLHSRVPLTKDSTTPVVLRGDFISLASNLWMTTHHRPSVLYSIYLQLPFVSRGHSSVTWRRIMPRQYV